MSSSAAGTAQLFWWKRDQTVAQFSETAVPVQAGTRTYEIDLSGNANWSGQITRFRLDPIDSAGVNFVVDRISVVPVMLAPRITNSDLIVNSPTPVFLWDGVIDPGRSGVTFTVEVARDFEFSSTVFTRSGLTGGRCVYDGTNALDGSYWWRVRAQDAGGAISPWAVPMPMFVRSWTLDRALDVVSSNQMQTPVVNGGTWTATTLGVDPYVHFNTGSPINRGINADVYKRFVVRVRANANSPGNIGQIFFFPKGGGFSSYAFPLPADNQWREIVVDMSGIAEWKGYIESVRLDPVSMANVEVALDYAYFLPSTSGGTVANQVPQFTKGANWTVSEDCAAVINNAWVSSSSPGADEEWQTLSYLVSNSNTALFSVAPTINQAGTLTFQPAANASGLAEVTVRIQDNGGTANGGIDTSAPQTFLITVTPVNDPPIAIGDTLFAHSQVTSAFPATSLLANDMDVDGDPLNISSSIGHAAG